MKSIQFKGGDNARTPMQWDESLNGDFQFSLEHFTYLFTETKYLKWVVNTLFIAFANVFITILFVSFTGFVYSRYRFKGRKPSLMAIMLIQSYLAS